MARVDDLCDPDDWVGACQQCGRPIYASETLCRACRWGVALADAEAEADDGQDATPPEGAALTDEALSAIRARWAHVSSGPWSYATDGKGRHAIDDDHGVIADLGNRVRQDSGRVRDAVAIAAAPDDMATLLAATEELAALRARCAELARLVDALRRQLAGGAYGN